MQKAEPQHGQTQHQPASKQGGGRALASPQGEHIAQLKAMMDGSPQATKLAGLAAMMNARPTMAAQRKLADMNHNSPRKVAQQNKFGNHFGTAQRVEDDEPLQKKLNAQPAQLEQQPATKPNNTGLPDNLKSGIENLSGFSMGSVKVHYNSSQPAQLNALAYAQGTDIHIAPGQEQHLPHEAWHVVQQAQGRVQPTMQMKDGIPVNDDKGLEHEADVMGGRALQLAEGEKANIKVSAPVYPNADAVAQKIVADCSDGNSIAGYFRTTNYRNLPEKAKAYFQVLYNDPQYRYTFASRNKITEYITNNPSAEDPEMEILEKDYSSGIKPYDKNGSSSLENVTKQTEQHHHHWRNYFKMHANIAYKTAGTEEAKQLIQVLSQEHMAQAIMMDDSEMYYAGDVDSEVIENVKNAPLIIREVLEAMYEIANKTTEDTLSPSLDSSALNIPVFGSMTASSIGTSAEIRINQYGSFPQGSGAAPEHAANPYWYLQLNKRRSINGGNVYIRGHLLNDHMGGPARPYNLIPLASDANMTHFGTIEDKAKEALLWMIKNRNSSKSPSSADIKGIHYSVYVLKTGQDRPIWTNRFITAPTNFQDVLDQMSSTNADPTVAEFKIYVKAHIDSSAYEAFYQQQIRAVIANGDDTVKIKKLMPLIRENAELWEMEAREVPRKIGYNLVIKKLAKMSRTMVLLIAPYRTAAC